MFPPPTPALSGSAARSMQRFITVEGLEAVKLSLKVALHVGVGGVTVHIVQFVRIRSQVE